MSSSISGIIQGKQLDENPLAAGRKNSSLINEIQCQQFRICLIRLIDAILNIWKSRSEVFKSGQISLFSKNEIRHEDCIGARFDRSSPKKLTADPANSKYIQPHLWHTILSEHRLLPCHILRITTALSYVHKILILCLTISSIPTQNGKWKTNTEKQRKKLVHKIAVGTNSVTGLNQIQTVPLWSLLSFNDV